MVSEFVCNITVFFCFQMVPVWIVSHGTNAKFQFIENRHKQAPNIIIQSSFAVLKQNKTKIICIYSEFREIVIGWFSVWHIFGIQQTKRIFEMIFGCSNSFKINYVEFLTMQSNRINGNVNRNSNYEGSTYYISSMPVIFLLKKNCWHRCDDSTNRNSNTEFYKKIIINE